MIDINLNEQEGNVYKERGGSSSAFASVWGEALERWTDRKEASTAVNTGNIPHFLRIVHAILPEPCPQGTAEL